LCEALNVRPDFFHRSSVIELGEINFRKLNKFPVKDKNKIIQQTRETLSSYLEVEDILNIENTFVNPLDGFDISEPEKIEQAAEHVREKWELGFDPIYNIIELFEDKGIKIIEVNESDEFSGMGTWVNTIPVIVINMNEHIPADRKRFTAMHELGHLLLFKQLEHLAHDGRERICNRFAGAMLLPSATLKKEIGEHRNKIYINELGELKKQYGISIQSISYRLKDQDVIPGNFHKQFMFMLSHLGFRRIEPAQYDFKGEEKSNRFKQLIFRALAEELISVSKAASLCNLKVAEFRDRFLMAG
ncbi:MAG: ImmA/IrrE family metallo-endopeptidase, partial [Bacteroidia bacterium]|nr:ImmA/IrrE family metallo-endopeptidase [Bacteroidia bacterium]